MWHVGCYTAVLVFFKSYCEPPLTVKENLEIDNDFVIKSTPT